MQHDTINKIDEVIKSIADAIICDQITQDKYAAVVSAFAELVTARAQYE